MKYLWAILATAVFCCSTAIYAQDDLISPKKLQRDFSKLVELLEAHPTPYFSCGEEAFNKKKEEVRKALNEPLSLLDFYKKANSLLAMMKDGHSSLYLPQDWWEKTQKKNGLFPYEVHLSNDNKMYVVKSLGEKEIPGGSEILSIEGLTVGDFLDEIDPYISYENQNFRNTLIDNNFERYLYLVFGKSKALEIEYRQIETKTITTSNMEYKEWKKTDRKDRDERERKIARGEPYNYKSLNNGVGLLSVYSFSVSDFKAYELFLNETFKQIANENIHSLIIDIRGNYGGMPKVSSKLFHYFTESHFKTMAQSSMKVSFPYRRHLKDRYPGIGNVAVIRQRQHFVDMTAVMTEDFGSYVNEEYFFNEAPHTEESEFTGDVYLLINRDSYSAASGFAATFQCYQMGVIIGEETGGTRIFRANAFTEKLLASNMIARISTTLLFNTCYNKEFEGVKPNVQFQPTILDLVSGSDTQLFYTLNLIRKIQKRKAE